ncbi:MAG: alpha/beta hydrolase [Caldilineaceae bacterium]|nr:alpha/beta hydrolase [Caldilineaceae bacterium]
MQQRRGLWVLLLGILLVGCTPLSGEPSIDHLMTALRAMGASVQLGSEVSEVPAFPLTVPRQLLQVNGDELQIYAYPDAAAAQAEAAGVALDGFSFTPQAGAAEALTVDWVDTPHFFQQAQLIVLYVGDNLVTLDYLNSVLGPQFAGGESTTVPFGVDGEFANGVRYRNLIIHLTDHFGSKGQLTFPPTGAGPWPTVILFSGTGPADMDASYSAGVGQASSTNFQKIAEAFGEAGIAVLRFNKRGVLAHGEYDYEQLQQTFVNQRIIDAEAVMTTAKAQPEVDDNQIFLYGWSEGGIVATYTAYAHPEVAGLLLQAPLNLRLEEALVYQHLNIGLPYLEEVIDQDGDGKLSPAEVAAIPAGPVWFLGLFSTRTSFLAALLPLQPNLDLDNDGLVDIQTELRPFVEGLIPLVARIYAGMSPSRTIAELVPALAMPILVLHGDRDGWIPVEAAIAIAGAAPDRVTLLRYPTLGHALSPTERMAEDSFYEMAEEPIQDMIAWIQAQLP